MHTDLKSAIRTALSGSSSQRSVDVVTLYKLGRKQRVEAALMEMYQAKEVCCCKITTRGKPPIQLSPASGRKGERENPVMTERIVWWLSGGDLALPRYGNTGRSAAA